MFRRDRLSDAQIVRRVLAGRRNDFGALVERYLPTVHALAYAKMGNHADAEDAAQETFVKAFQGLDSLRDAAKFGPWLLTIARNTCARFLRTRARSSAVAEKAEPATVAAQPDVEKREIRELLRQQVMELEEGPREVLLLHYFADKSVAEIGALLGISTEAAKKRLQRARQTLSGRLADQLGDILGPKRSAKQRTTRLMGILAATPAPWQLTAPSGGLTLATAANALGGLLIMKKLILVAVATALLVIALWRFGIKAPLSTPGVAIPAAKTAVDAEVKSQGAAGMPVAASDLTRVTASASDDARKERRAASEPKLTGPGAIFGAVIDADGAPAPGATVELHLVSGPHSMLRQAATAGFPQMVQADERGHFEFTALPVSRHAAHARVMSEAVYVVQAHAERAFASQCVNLQAYNQPQKRLTLQLGPAGVIAGVVRDGSGKAVPGATLYAHPPTELFWGGNTLRAETDAAGKFVFDNLPYGDSRFLVLADGLPNTLTDFFSIGDRSVDIVLVPGARVSGRVIRAGSEAPCPDIHLIVVAERFPQNHVECDTNAAGTFMIPSLAPDAYAVIVDDPVLIAAGGPLTVVVAPGQAEKQLEVVVTPGGVIAGRVYDEDTGNGISGVSVYAKREDKAQWRRTSAPSDDEGRYRIEGLATGWHVVASYANDDYTDERPVRTDKGRVAVEAGATVSDVDFALPAGRIRVAGKVVDEKGAPAPNAPIMLGTVAGQVTIWGGQTRCTADATGAFAFRVTPDGRELFLMAQHLERVSAPYGPFRPPETGASGILLTVGPGSSLTGVVVDRFGRPMPGASVSASSREWGVGVGPEQSADTDNQGRFEIVGLTAGAHLLRVLPEGRNIICDRGPMEATLAAGERRTGIRLVYDDPLAVSGRVTDEAGLPIPGAKIGLPQHGDVLTTTDADGSYTVMYLDEATRELWATHPAYQSACRTDVELGRDDIDFTLLPKTPPVWIEGRVLDSETGEPFKEFEVTWMYGKDAEPRRIMTLDYPVVHDAEGRFRLSTDLRENDDGYRTVIARAPGFPPAAEVISLSEAVDGAVHVELRLEPGAEITGVVTNTLGQPLAGAYVVIGAMDELAYRSDASRIHVQALRRIAAAHTGQDGVFHIETLAPTDRLLTAHCPDYAPGWANITPNMSQPSEIKIVLSDGGALSGTISVGEHLAGGRSLGGELKYTNQEEFGRVYLDFPLEFLYHPEAGYRFERLAVGEARLVMTLPSRLETADPRDHSGAPHVYHCLARNVVIEEGKTATADFDFVRGDAVIAGVATIDGRCPRPNSIVARALGDGAPGEYFYTWIDETHCTYRFEGLPEGTLAVELAWPGSSDPPLASAVVETRSGEVTRQDLAL
ncbi:MAG TPA: sigma-70 family RNA polymerase sigma factor [Candidatus Hydrogenedentes bacterium]|nr:sigma-70 family RNA polymerase sigma factor [Candidatus Hydrogenedentota bacterium]